jgi:hypothetical protein
VFITSVLIVAMCLAFATVAQAQATRTWVSGVGDDANPCSRTAPCKTFAGAISKTAAGGEIDALDPGGFGAVTITKAITIDGGSPGMGGILANGGVTGVIINAGAGDQVTLKNLQIMGAGTGITGVNFINGLALHVIKCQIDGFTQFGINFHPGGTGFLFVEDSRISRAAAGGILVNGTSTFQRASIVRTESDASLFGFKATSQALVDISDSVAAVGGDSGFSADGANVKMFIVNSRANLNFTGVRAVNNAEVRFLNGSIAHSASTPTTTATGGTIVTTGTVFMP